MNAHQSLILTTLLTSLVLGGCTTTKQIDISAKPIAKPGLTLPSVSKLNMRDVKWKIVNAGNVDQVLADLEKKGENVVLFAVTDKGYEALSLNTADLRKLIMQQQAIIAAYESYYVKSQSALDKANNEIRSVNKAVSQ